MMLTDRPFRELNLWQRIFAEHCESFLRACEAQHHRCLPSHGEDNVQKRLSCDDIRQGYGEYLCPHCQTTRQVLLEGVVQRTVVLKVPKEIRPLFLAEPKLRKTFADAEARAVQPWVAPLRPKKTIKVGILSSFLFPGREGISLAQRLATLVLTVSVSPCNGPLCLLLTALEARRLQVCGLVIRALGLKRQALAAVAFVAFREVAQQVGDVSGRRCARQRGAAAALKAAGLAPRFGDMAARSPRYVAL